MTMKTFFALVMLIVAGCNVSPRYVRIDGATCPATERIATAGTQVSVATFTDNRLTKDTVGKVSVQDIRIEGNPAVEISEMLVDAMRRSGADASLDSHADIVVSGSVEKISLSCVYGMNHDYGDCSATVSAAVSVKTSKGTKNLGVITGQAEGVVAYDVDAYYMNATLQRAAANCVRNILKAMKEQNVFNQ